jgi:photosystem I subunit PsaN
VKIDQELNDKKRLATSGANFARAYTVEFGSCKFPYNFTGCQDLAKQKVQSKFTRSLPRMI